ncbi:cell wall assembly and cell proliferation coordinating protein [Nadsonia fulvescens var. elongata DSM 6958]|uniref:Cell wall assembly and cell proliferation coordinating protein n=1 Tax=Nadsonia fulvescens var. elongata DSM 6958 TaxID=857566 RepID=A0A1E3PNY0_9ASCO|nr:cell wall assembly and cell proliferation coordinating protein [Nadsonia fulvescens var. elongata DSM 6958]
MKSFLHNVSSFVHSITTDDHYASYGSQYKSSPLTKSGSSDDIDPIHTNSTYYRSGINGSSSNIVSENGQTGSNINETGRPYGASNYASYSSDRLNNANPYGSTTNLAASGSSSSLNKVNYTPGMRSSHIGNASHPSEIPLQDYNDGAPLPPPVSVSWQRIDQWTEDFFPELYDQLCYPASSADLNELENDLDCTLPLDVRDSYLVHDGQEKWGKPAGIIYGITLLDLESISEEWDHWRLTAVKLNKAINKTRSNPPSSLGVNSRSDVSLRDLTAKDGIPSSNDNWLYHQESVPEECIQKVYAHPGWIPLAKDFCGNNIAVDLAPGPRGKWGQVILFGRDFDRKFVVAPSWAAFLAQLADDFGNGNVEVDNTPDSEDIFFKTDSGRLLSSYFTVLKSRVERQVRQNKRLPKLPSHSNSSVHNTNHSNSVTNLSLPSKRIPSTNSMPQFKQKQPLSSPATPSLISPVASSANLMDKNSTADIVISINGTKLENFDEEKEPESEKVNGKIKKNEDLSLSDVMQEPTIISGVQDEKKTEIKLKEEPSVDNTLAADGDLKDEQIKDEDLKDEKVVSEEAEGEEIENEGVEDEEAKTENKETEAEEEVIKPELKEEKKKKEESKDEEVTKEEVVEVEL